MCSLRFALPLLAFALLAQSTPVQRDSQAVTLVQRAAVALSPTAPTLNPSSHVGILVTGTFYPSNGPAGSGFAVRVKILAYDKVRWEFDQPEGTLFTVVNSGVAWRTGPNGTVGLSLGDMMGRQLEALPFLALADWLSDPNVNLSDLGVEMIENAQLRHLTVAYPYRLDPSGSFHSVYKAVSTCDLYLDTATQLPAKLHFQRYPGDVRIGVPIELGFSGYKQLSGFQVPVVTYSIHGHIVGEYHFDSVSLNVPIAPTDFEEN